MVLEFMQELERVVIGTHKEVVWVWKGVSDGLYTKKFSYHILTQQPTHRTQVRFDKFWKCKVFPSAQVCMETY